METPTGPSSEPRKMRVSFLVLAGVIAVCSTNASAKAVPTVTEDEANSVGQGPAEQDPRNDTASETGVKKSNAHDGEHVLIKRQAVSDSGKRRSVISKRFDKRRKTETKKFKHEESKTRTVSSKTRSVKKDKSRHGKLSFNNWYVPEIKPKSYSFPVIYNSPIGDYNPWNAEPNLHAIMGSQQHELTFLPPKDIIKVEEWADVFHQSLRAGMESLFEALGKELKKKLGYEDAPAVPHRSQFARSSCIDTGDGSYESDPADDCPDDTPATANGSGNGAAPSDMSKRSESEYLKEYLKQELPVIVQAAETILGESNENTRSFGGGGIVADDGMYDWRSSAWGAGDEAVPDPDDGIDNGKSVSWDLGDPDADRVPSA